MVMGENAYMCTSAFETRTWLHIVAEDEIELRNSEIYYMVFSYFL